MDMSDTESQNDIDKESPTNGQLTNSDDDQSDSASSAAISSEDENSDSDSHDVGSHIKSGSLSFGLPENKEPPARQILKSFSTKPAMSYRGLVFQKRNLQAAKIQQELQELEKIEHFSEELKEGYRILSNLMSSSLSSYNEAFMDELDPESPGSKEYLSVIDQPIFFNEVQQKFLDSHYETITNLIKDIRLIFENTYRYYGPSNSYSKRALHLEYHLECELGKLSEKLQKLCSLEKTHPNLTIDETESVKSKAGRIVIQNTEFFSKLLYSVKGCRSQREKNAKLQKQEAMKEARRKKELEIIHWEQSLVSGKNKSQLEHSWEIPQIGQFLYLANPALHIPPVPQFELERCLLIPQCSLVLRSIITSLVSSPIQRPKISEKPYMPYNTWAKKLASKVYQWYKYYQKENGNAEKALENLGIEPTFWAVCGETNPFQTMLFHEMSFYQRIWLLKSLCDYTAHNHKSVAEIIAEQPEEIMRESVLGTDLDDHEYIYFPQFISFDLRIYRRRSPRISDSEEESASSPDQQDEEKTVRMFSKEQLKHYKSIVRRSRNQGHQKKRKNEEDEWFQSQTAKKKAKRKSNATPKPTPPMETRTRPTNLRQRPKMRFTEDLDSSEDELLAPPRKINGTRARRTREPTPLSSEDSDSDPVPEKIELAQVKNSRRNNKKKKTCDICGKTFTSVGSLRGHMGVHSKAKSLNVSREASPVPNDESTADLPITESETSRLDDTVNCPVSPKDISTSELKPSEDKKEDFDEKEDKSDVKIKSEMDVKTEEPETPVKEVLEKTPASLDYSLFLVVSNADELRVLIETYGPLPSKPKKEKVEDTKNKASDSDNDDDADEEQEPSSPVQDTEENSQKVDRKLSANESELYKNLCSLYLEVQTFEGKLRTLQRSSRRRMFNEFNEWNKRLPGYVDPAEEAWMSEPEAPEPSPAPETPKVSSSSSSSEDEYYDDGVRKRKLRKRKAKKNAVANYVTSAEPTPVPSPLYEDDSETLSVSSRGRIRRQRKMVDYDQLDFDKLAEEAESNPKEKKKRVADPKASEQELKEAAKNLQLPSSGVKKYLFGATGNVVGYMDNSNKIHYNSNQTKEGAVKQAPVRPISSVTEHKPITTPTPVLIVSAVNSLKSSVCLRVQGVQALEMANAIKKSGPNKDIKINHCNQIFFINTSDVVLTKKIPGWPDCDISNPVETLAKKRQEREALKAAQRSPLKQNATPVWGAAAKASQSSPAQVVKPKTVALMSNGKPVQVRLNLAGQQKNQTLYAVPNSSGGFSLTQTLSTTSNSSATNNLMVSSVPTVRPTVQSSPIITTPSVTPIPIQQTPQSTPGYVRIVQQKPNQVVVQNLANNAGQSNVVSSPQISRPVFVSNAPATPQRIFIQQAEQPVTQPTIFYQQPVVQQTVQPQVIQQVVQQPLAPKPQNKIVVVQTSGGQKVCVQTPEGKLIVLTDEQLAPLIANGTVKIQNS